MKYMDAREPIEFVVDEYFKRQSYYKANERDKTDMDGVRMARGEYEDDTLPDTPCTVIRNADGIVYKVIYGDINAIAADDEASPIVWMEELMRDADGNVTEIITTYPDGETQTNYITRDSNGKFEGVV